jgi:hypothetical protein
MLWLLIAVLVVIWIVAVVLKYTIGGLIHLLLIVALGILIFNLVM